MKKFFLLSAITLCLAAKCVLAQYQTAPAYGNGNKQQRKMSPSPSGYGQKQQQQPQSPSYNSMPQQMQEMNQIKEASAGYDNQQSMANDAAQGAAYGAQQQQQSYGKQQAGPGKSHGAQSSGYGKQAAKYEEPQHPPMPFAWGYDINDGYGTTQYHKENGDEYGKRTGSYGYMDAYGVYRHVNYVADENGFRATVKTNEPGTANESPADVDWTAEEPPANVNPGNKEKSSYGDSTGSSYGGDSSSSQYGGQSGSSNGIKSYGGSNMMSDSGAHGQSSMMAEQSPMQKYGSMSMGMADAQAKSYQAGAGKQQPQQQYGAGMSQGMMAGLMAGSKQQQQQQYGSGSGASMGAGYGQQNGANMMLAGKPKARRYGSQGSPMRGSNGAYQNAMEAEPASQGSTTQSPYGQTGDESAQQQYAGSNGRMGAMNSQYGGEQSLEDSMGQQQQQYGSDSALAQQYGPPTSMLNSQAQQYGASPAATSGEGSTYSSMRMQSTGPSSYGTKQASSNGAMSAYKQQQQPIMMMMTAPANGGTMDYRKMAGKGIAALAAKRY